MTSFLLVLAMFGVQSETMLSNQFVERCVPDEGSILRLQLDAGLQSHGSHLGTILLLNAGQLGPDDGFCSRYNIGEDL